MSHTKSELLGLAKVDNWSMTLKSDLLVLLQFHDTFFHNSILKFFLVLF